MYASDATICYVVSHLTKRADKSKDNLNPITFKS